MKCPKGGDVREFLEGLRSRRHHLCSISVTVTDTEYQRTVLHGILDSLTAFASQMLNSLDIASTYTQKPVDMSRLIDMISDKANQVKTHRALKDQAQNKGKKADQGLSFSGNHHLCIKRPVSGSQFRVESNII